MKTLASLLWLSLPMVTYGVYASFGTPHLIYEYSFSGGDRYRLGSDRHYTSCTYVGWSGRKTVPATNGACPWVRLFHAGVDQ